MSCRALSTSILPETLAPGTPVTIHPATFGTPEPGIEDRPHLWPNGAYLGSASTWPHTQGGMSEFLVVGKHMLRTLPATLPLRRAALAEPLAVASACHRHRRRRQGQAGAGLRLGRDRPADTPPAALPAARPKW